ncbi:MAG: hypothetical protein HY703_12580, partial [Gemmatimonadetes bacterium]|nr:hypothetical protein [Gemmatimonadota bacterium]
AGLALGGGLLYIVDSANQRVRAVELASGVIKSVAGTGIRGFAGDGGPATEALLQDPQGVAVSPDGRTLFIADAGNHRVRTVNLATGLIATFAGTGDEAFTGDRGPAGETALSGPTSVAASPFSLLFIADTGHHIVWRSAVRF